MVKNLIVNLLKRRLGKQNFEILPRTPEKKIKNLISSLIPVQTEKELIRLGPEWDGGYLVVDDLEGIEACFSPGVDKEAGFEEDCARKFKMKIFLADKSIDFPPKFPKEVRYEFMKKFIGVWNDNSFITLDSWVDQSGVGSDSDLLLQMDIEGAEYFSLLNLSDHLQKRFRVIIVEFHDLEKLFVPEFFDIANNVFTKLLKTHYCVHIHPNNYGNLIKIGDIDISKYIEMTFHRKDRLTLKTPILKRSGPHNLDRKNIPDKPDILLSKGWY